PNSCTAPRTAAVTRSLSIIDDSFRYSTATPGSRRDAAPRHPVTPVDTAKINRQSSFVNI
ncbi:hypothetical protein, partial [uncultured Bacteroides sp.]|uniref:hypothetical protein n=1 Tax=uncultured Bacteroides sp. TaxID=162156 RepID=UPI0026706B16